MRLSERARRVVVVGAGLGGTATAVRLLQFAREPVEILLVERCPAQRSAGVAYHPAGNHWEHVFNIQAGRMAMFREDVDDFVAWANEEADRTGWPQPWRDTAFTESGPAPRRIYADYLATRLADAAREAPVGVTLVEANGEVVDLDHDGDTGRLRVVVDGFSLPGTGSEPTRLTVPADHVIIATGLEERELAFAAQVADHPGFVRRPYSETGVERITAVAPEATVAIIGTLLSAYDSAALLLRRGHTGPIRMISRSGLTLRTYPEDHQHKVLDLPAPRLPAFGDRAEFVAGITREWQRACAAMVELHPDIAPAVVTERVAKSWEPHLAPMIAGIPTADLRALLDGYGSLLATLRVSAVAYTTGIVEDAMARGQVALRTGAVGAITATGTGTLLVTVAGADPVEADLVIANFGREPDYQRVGSPLWRALFDRGVALAHRRSGQGVEVDEAGTLLDATGAPSGPISAVGGPREGDEIVRHGRMGAFAFNLAAIKNHSVGVASTVLRRIETCYDDAAELAMDSPLFERAVQLDVHRMSARGRAESDALAAELENTVAALVATGVGGDRAVRAAVNRAAAIRLNDLSVTPRQLRGRLGLDQSA